MKFANAERKIIMKLDDAVIRFAQLHNVRNMKDVEMLQMMMLGMTYKEMASRLDCTLNNIQKRASKIIIAANVNGREGIMAKIYEMGKVN